MNIWLDDTRPPKNPAINIRWVKSYHEFTAFYTKCLEDNTPIDYVSLDHDLGTALDDNHDDILAKTGLDVANWMMFNIPPFQWPREINVHSANPVAAEHIESFLEAVAPRFVKLTWERR